MSTPDLSIVIVAWNVRDLVLRADTVRAVERGQFHVAAVRTVDDALELITGEPAGERHSDGSYPEESLNGRVNARLAAYAEVARRFGGRD